MMNYIRMLGRWAFGPNPKVKCYQNWEPDRVTKEEMVTLFARELQRNSKIEQ
jgi:hypothetical protein